MVVLIRLVVKIISGLTISTEKQQPLKDIAVDVSGLAPRLADRFMARAYQKGYDKITLKFDDPELMLAIKNKIPELMGFEILDIDKNKIPKNVSYLDFNKDIIDQTKDLVCAYKINMAFYEVLGKQGYEILEKTVDYTPNDILVILDGKRNDIGNTAKKYAQSLFETLKADAVTINPYLGSDGIKPFLEYKDKCSFVLCRTSNPSAKEFLSTRFDLLLQADIPEASGR